MTDRLAPLLVLVLLAPLAGCKDDPAPDSPAPAAAETTGGASPGAGFEHPDVGDVEDPLEQAPLTEEQREARRVKAEKVRKERTLLRMERLPGKIRAYVVDQKPRKLPGTLYDLVEPAAGGKRYAAPNDIKDGWGNEIILTPKGKKNYELRSVGPDNAYGGDDDIVEEH